MHALEIPSPYGSHQRWL